MAIRSQAVRKKLHARHVFRIARGPKPFVENVFLALEQKGFMGYGEASPNAFYQETTDDVHMRLLGLADWLKRQTIASPEDIAALHEEVWPWVAPSRAAQCAVDLALWDLLAKTQATTVASLVSGSSAHPIQSSATLGLGSLEEQREFQSEAHDFHRWKLKVAGQPNPQHLAALRQTWTQTKVNESQNSMKREWSLDANGSWSADESQAWQKALENFPIALLEQPFAPNADQLLTKQKWPCPVYADESFQREIPLSTLVNRYQGITLKLVKCGGLTPALQLRKQARELGMKVMVGCMLESSLLISAGHILAQDCDWADLDGAWLLADDPFLGMHWSQGYLHAGQGLGFGVKPQDHFPERSGESPCLI